MMLRISIKLNRYSLFSLLLALAIPQIGSAAQTISHQKRKAAGVWAEVVTIDMNNSDVKLAPAITRRGIGHSERFQTFLDRTRPTAAITGTFFDTRSLCPVGDIVVEGTMVNRGVVGTAIGIGWNNEVTFIPTKRGVICDWSSYRHVLAAGPQLLVDRKITVAPWNEGFSDGGIYASRPRAAIGQTKQNKIMFVAIKRPLQLTQLARVMRSLGCVNAAVLDGGSSTALYYRGKIITHPARKLTNVLLAYDNSIKYDQAVAHLAPNLRDRLAERRQEATDTIELVFP